MGAAAKRSRERAPVLTGGIINRRQMARKKIAVRKLNSLDFRVDETLTTVYGPIRNIRWAEEMREVDRRETFFGRSLSRSPPHCPIKKISKYLSGSSLDFYSLKQDKVTCGRSIYQL